MDLRGGSREGWQERRERRGVEGAGARRGGEDEAPYVGGERGEDAAHVLVGEGAEEQIDGLSGSREIGGQSLGAAGVVGGVEEDPSAAGELDLLQPPGPAAGRGTPGDGNSVQARKTGLTQDLRRPHREAQVLRLVGAGEADFEVVAGGGRRELDPLAGPASLPRLDPLDLHLGGREVEIRSHFGPKTPKPL